MEPLSWAILAIIVWYFLIKFVKEIDKEKEKKKKENKKRPPLYHTAHQYQGLRKCP